ncbi:MAG: hypothetical protein PHO37_18720 [Kiritimatiellae bacterium]|nr:hypothetical protein [Kiritimatiellia bacterium]
MKKILTVTLALAAVGWAQGAMAPITGSNEVGFSTVPATAGATQIITVPYVACLSENAEVMLADLVSTNGLVSHASDPSNADQLIVMVDISGDLRYYYYWLQSDVGWTGVETSVMHPDGTTSSVTPTAANAFAVARGKGFWLKRAATGGNAVYVKGEVSGTTPVTPAITTGLNLVGYGTAAAVNINDVTWSGANGGNGNTKTSDAIMVVESDGSLSHYYYFTAPDGWPAAYQELNGKWIKEDYSVANVTVPAGQGFWYLRRSAN